MAKPILLYTSIWDDTATDITNQILEATEGEGIDIWINSPGGSVPAGYSILAALQESKEQVSMTVMGDASSMAFFALLFADNTKAYDTANFLIHRAASYWEDFMSEDELKDIQARNKVLRKKLESKIDEDIFEDVTGKTFDEIFDMETRIDVRLTAKQAKKIGLIDEVVKLDVKKRKEIESRYYNDIAALSTKAINTNINNMGNKLKDLLFGEKDPILTATIGDRQFVYSKIEAGASVKPTGKGEQAAISGTFEAEGKSITVTDNEITAVSEIDARQEELKVLKVELEALKKDQLTAEAVAEVIIENNKAYDAKITALEAKNKELGDALAKAKITTSNPTLPEGEFQNDGSQSEALSLREKLVAAQNKAHEEKVKKREA
jgi:ATP-dependent Clp protease protease subunit